MSTTPMASAPSPDSPLRYDVQYPESLNRVLNNPFLIWIKWILAIPHLAILYVLTLVVYVIIVIAFFSILFTKKYPKGMHDFVVNFMRWQTNVYAYIFMLRDEYPPFGWDAGKYPVTLEVDYEPELSRFGPWYKWLLVIPNFIVWYLVIIVAAVLWLVAGFAILFTGKFPRGMFDFVVGAGRWGMRLNMYAFYLMSDKYPPFSMKQRCLSDAAEPAPPKPWYENVWVALLAGYIFAPLGLYLMWRYQPWPVWLKVTLTAFGLTAMVVGTYLSTKYGPVSVF